MFQVTVILMVYLGFQTERHWVGNTKVGWSNQGNEEVKLRLSNNELGQTGKYGG
jgi:hypothetical protein